MLHFLLKPYSCLVREVCFESKLILPKSNSPPALEPMELCARYYVNVSEESLLAISSEFILSISSSSDKVKDVTIISLLLMK